MRAKSWEKASLWSTDHAGRQNSGGLSLSSKLQGKSRNWPWFLRGMVFHLTSLSSYSPRQCPGEGGRLQEVMHDKWAWHDSPKGAQEALADQWTMRHCLGLLGRFVEKGIKFVLVSRWDYSANKYWVQMLTKPVPIGWWYTEVPWRKGWLWFSLYNTLHGQKITEERHDGKEIPNSSNLL